MPDAPRLGSSLCVIGRPPAALLLPMLIVGCFTARVFFIVVRVFQCVCVARSQLEAEGIGIDDARRTWRYLPAPAGGYAPVPEAEEDEWPW